MCSKWKMGTTFYFKKTSATPTFCKRNCSRMNDVGDMNFFSFPTFIGNRYFDSKGYFNWNILENKVCIGYQNDTRQFLTPIKIMDHYWFFSHKLVWFGMIWVPVTKVDLWAFFPLNFYHRMQIFNQNWKMSTNMVFWNSPCCETN